MSVGGLVLSGRPRLDSRWIHPIRHVLVGRKMVDWLREGLSDGLIFGRQMPVVDTRSIDRALVDGSATTKQYREVDEGDRTLPVLEN